MATQWRTAVRQALPDSVLRASRAARLGWRDLQHRLRWLITEGAGPGLGIGIFDGRPIAYRLRTADNHVLGHSFGHDIFFAAIPDMVLPDDAVVLDVGAHIGTFSLLASERAPRGRVYAVEASRESARLLAINVRLNHRPNVEVAHLALADTDGFVDLHHDLNGNWGHSITARLSDSAERVPATTLTRFLDDRGIKEVAVAKFNCEGAEFPILLTTPSHVLRRIDRAIVLYHSDLTGVPVETLTEWFGKSGFATAVTRESEHRGWIVATRQPLH